MNHTDQPGTPDSASHRRAEALRRAAQHKREAATARAEAAIRQLVKERHEINFRTVARTGGISLDFLYANSDLRRRIQTLRTQQATQPPSPAEPANSDSNIVHVLTAKLREERASRHTAEREHEQRIAAAHGEILRLRRVLQQHNIQA
jgi:hypothetical protein